MVSSCNFWNTDTSETSKTISFFTERRVWKNCSTLRYVLSKKFVSIVSPGVRSDPALLWLIREILTKLQIFSDYISRNWRSRKPEQLKILRFSSNRNVEPALMSMFTKVFKQIESFSFSWFIHKNNSNR